MVVVGAHRRGAHRDLIEFFNTPLLYHMLEALLIHMEIKISKYVNTGTTKHTILFLLSIYSNDLRQPAAYNLDNIKSLS